MKLEDIKKQMDNAVINAENQKKAKKAEITKLQERLAQVLIGIDDALLNDNEEALTKLTNEKREIEEKINLYNNFLKDFNKKPVLSEEKAQKLYDELLNFKRTYEEPKKIENIKKLINELDKEVNDLYDLYLKINNLCGTLRNVSANKKYDFAFKYKDLIQGYCRNTYDMKGRLQYFDK